MNVDWSTKRYFLMAAWIVMSTTVALADLPVTGGAWVSQGPAPIQAGQTEGIANAPVAGAIHGLVPHPTDSNTVWIGAANGGIWKTTNATAASPTWTPMTDTFSSLSIGALALDPTDGTHNTLVAGLGRFSSLASLGGPRNGLLRTTNGGTNWTALTPALLTGKNISGLAARGATIVVSVNVADSFVCGNIGVFRSIDTGGTFTMISGGGGSGLPLGRAFDIAGDPTNNAVLYTAIKDTEACVPGLLNGIYKSTDTGATWTRVSNATMNTMMLDVVFSGARIVVGLSGEVYAGIIDDDGQLAGLFRSGTGGSSWTQLDTPSTNEGGSPIGTHPTKKPGGQGALHFSLAADPTNSNIVYVGGDRQPLNGDGSASTPNSIGATNFTGRLFRVNAAAGAGTQSTPLTHCILATAACNSTTSTVNNSSPHADSRRMAFDAAGNLLEADDGGIYRRTNPRTTGDWFSVNGNLQVTEAHDVAYDRVSNMIITGNQDTGTSEQTSVGGTTWNEVSQGDGGDVSVDDTSSGTQSRRYSSFQNLGSFRRRIMDAAGVVSSQTFPALTVLSGGPALVAQFVTPVEVNTADPTRVLIAGFNDMYESLDRGDTITALGFNITSPAIVYGGRSGGIDNVNLIYAISGVNVFARTAGSGPPVLTAASPGGTLRDIAVDSEDWQKAFVINSSGQVFSTINTGASWTNITGNLASGATDLRSIVFVPGSPSAIVVGGVNGVFRMATDNVGVWNQFGSGLSNAPVFDMDYDSADDTLVAGTLGRGVWKLNPVANLGPLPTLSINDVIVTEGNAGSTNAVFNVTLTPASAGTVTVNFATADGTATLGINNFSNSSSMTIPTSGNATLFPSGISVAGLTGNITKVTATLNGFSHSFTSDVDILLVGPTGQSVVLMSDVGGFGNNVNNLTLTVDDAAASTFPGGAFGSGTFQPTNINDGEGTDTFDSPAPAGPHGATLSLFNGTAPNGTWNLFVRDDFAPDGGSISGGWTISIQTGTGDYTFTSGILTFNPSVTSQPISVPVLGDVVDESSETFVVNLSSPSNATILDGQGVGTITDDDGAPPAPTNVVATATTSTNVNVTWTASAGATSYRVFRSSGGAFTLVGSPVGTTFDDTTAAANTAFLYRVRAFNGVESVDSNTDLATTVIFIDPTLTVSTTKAKLVHFTELLTAVNAVRTLALLGGISFTVPTPSTSVTIRRQHLLDLRAGLDAARAALTFSALTYTDPTITAESTKIKAVHITELREGLQ